MKNVRSKMRVWWVTLSDQWKATLRTAFQSAVGALGLFVLVVIDEAVDLVNGGTLSDSVADLSAAGRLLSVSLLSALTGLVSFWMNRAGRGARYSWPPPAPETKSAP